MISLKLAMKLLFIFLVIVYLKSLLIYKTYHALPLQELRRRARSKDKKATALYKVAVFDGSLDLLLWFFGSAGAAGMVLIAAHAAWWLAFIVAMAAAWLAVWLPKPKVDGWLWNLNAWTARYTAAILTFAQPVLTALGALVPKHRYLTVHTGLYEKEDLLDLLNDQNHQLDNRISEQELMMAFAALTFGEKKVSSAMTPRRKVMWVAASEPIGPMLMDDLHKSGFSRFPVVKTADKKTEPEVVGTVYLKDLIGHEDTGKVKDLMQSKAYFINEAQTLHQALDGFLKTHHHLLVVVNNFEEVVGVLTLEDVLEQIIGKQIVDEFDKYDSLRAVAGIEAKKEQATHHEPTVKPEN